ELGRYAAAYRFLDAIIALAASLGGPLFPRLSSVAVSAPGEARRLLEAGWRPLLALGLPLTVGTVLVAGDLVALLFGPEFAGAAPLLRLLILGALPLFWVNVANHALIAGGHRLRRHAVGPRLHAQCRPPRRQAAAGPMSRRP